MSCPVGGVLFRIGVLIHAYGFFCFCGTWIAVEASLYCCVWLWPGSVYTTSIYYSLSDVVGEQKRQEAERSACGRAEATGHVALHG
jgi:hypothetical protein